MESKPADTTSDANDTASNKSCCCGIKGILDSERTLAVWVLRLWLSIRAILTGVEKFYVNKTIEIEDADTGIVLEKSVKTFDISGHHGLPGGLAKQLGEQPLMPKWGLAIFDATLGYILIALGIMLLLGIGTRISLFAQGVLYSMLTVGFIMLNGPAFDAGIAYLGTHVLLVVAALVLVKDNKLVVLKKF
ncbi:MAG: hypothetical protein LBV12_07595 [Puniceicoccales bacterium]|jgi:thiosulfate dehydrogenase [quinone] large subunit|nr:hypothetical protein [Puniceicoccales bacterium]